MVTRSPGRSSDSLQCQSIRIELDQPTTWPIRFLGINILCNEYYYGAVPLVTWYIPQPLVLYYHVTIATGQILLLRHTHKECKAGILLNAQLIRSETRWGDW